MQTPIIVQFAAAVSALFAFLSFVTGLFISRQVYLTTRNTVKLQLLRSNFDVWKDIDTFLLSQPILLEMASKIMGADTEAHQKKRVTFLLLNPFYSYFYAMKNGYVSSEMKDKFDECLKPLLLDPDVFAITQKEVFVEGFAEHCSGLEQLAKNEELARQQAQNQEDSGDRKFEAESI